MAKRKKTDVVQLKLRLTESLRKKLEVGASARNRSLNSEILHRLEWTFWPQVERQMDAEVYADLLMGGNRGPDWRRVVEGVMKLKARSEGPVSPAPPDLAPPAPTSPAGTAARYRGMAAQWLRLAEATPGENRGSLQSQEMARQLQEMARLWAEFAKKAAPQTEEAESESMLARTARAGPLFDPDLSPRSDEEPELPMARPVPRNITGGRS